MKFCTSAGFIGYKGLHLPITMECLSDGITFHSMACIPPLSS
jgi:hypothetical protein